MEFRPWTRVPKLYSVLGESSDLYRLLMTLTPGCANGNHD